MPEKDPKKQPAQHPKNENSPRLTVNFQLSDTGPKINAVMDKSLILKTLQAVFIRNSEIKKKEPDQEDKYKFIKAHKKEAGLVFLASGIVGGIIYLNKLNKRKKKESKPGQSKKGLELIKQPNLLQLSDLQKEKINAITTEFRPKIVKLLTFRVNDPDIAEDLTQDIFIGLTLNFHKQNFKSDDEIKKYLFGSAYNISKNHYRNNSREKKYRTINLEHIVERSQKVSESEIHEGIIRLFKEVRKIEDNIIDTQVFEALNNISSYDNFVLSLIYYLEFNQEQVGNILGKSPSAVKSLHFRIIERLRNHIHKKDNTVPKK